MCAVIPGNPEQCTDRGDDRDRSAAHLPRRSLLFGIPAVGWHRAILVPGLSAGCRIPLARSCLHSANLANTALTEAPQLYSAWMFDPEREYFRSGRVPVEGVMITDIVALQPRPTPHRQSTAGLNSTQLAATRPARSTSAASMTGMAVPVTPFRRRRGLCDAAPPASRASPRPTRPADRRASCGLKPRCRSRASRCWISTRRFLRAPAATTCARSSAMCRSSRMGRW